MTTFDGDTPSGESVDVIETTDADAAAAPEAEVSLEAEEAAPTSDEIEQAAPDAPKLQKPPRLPRRRRRLTRLPLRPSAEAAPEAEGEAKKRIPPSP